MTLLGRPKQPVIVPPGSIPATTPAPKQARAPGTPPPTIYIPQPVRKTAAPGIGPDFALADHVHALDASVISSITARPRGGQLVQDLAVRDDGTNFIISASDAGLSTVVLTMEMWVQTTFTGTQVSMGYGTKPGGDAGAAGVFVINTQIGDGVEMFNVNVLDGNWHHVVEVFDGVNVILYVDGNLIGSQAVVKAVVLSGTMYVGQWVDAANRFQFHGAIDEPAVYSTALSATRVLAHYNARNDGTYAQKVLSDNPLRYWQFEETSGSSAFDASGHANGTYAVGGITLGVPGAVKKLGTSASAGANAGAGSPAPVVSGSDFSGIVKMGTGAGPAAGELAKATYSQSSSLIPVIAPGNAATANLGMYVFNVTTAGFSIGCASAPAASQAVGTYVIDYVCG